MYADYILKSNAVFDGCSDSFFPGAIAVKNNIIISICRVSGEEAVWTGPDTRVLSYDDQLILPGFGESHSHVFYGALELYSANLVEACSEEEAVDLIFQKEKSRNEDWIFAFGWNHHYWKKKELPTKRSLDRVFPNKPVAAINEELHGIWVNSKALEICGIDRNTEIPCGMGMIQKDENGEPTGFLLETAAMKLVLDKAFRMDAGKHEKLIDTYFDTTSRLGITSLSNLQIHDILMPEIFKSMDESNRLKVRMSLVASVNTPIEALLDLMQTSCCSSMLKFGGVKGFIDGTPMGYTGYLIDEYSDRPGFLGECYLDTESFGERAAEFERHDIRMRLHACGDNAVREALNIIEYARTREPGHNLRHTIEHIEVICPTDIGRFKQLGAVASVQPDHMWSLIFNEHPFHKILGPERCKHVYPFRSLQDSGVVLAFGSDHPIAELNPMRGVYRAVTRLSEDRQPTGGWCAEETLTVAQALRAYTAGSAYQMYNECITGTLVPGKRADIIVMDRNLFTVEPEEILTAVPLLTMLDGKIIYSE